MYNILLKLARNKYFYNDVKLPDTFESRIHLMFMHFSLILLVHKKKKIKFEQTQYDLLFYSIENNLRELGFGDVSVNEKMKNLNKILYDILLKIELKESKSVFKINQEILKKYFKTFNEKNGAEIRLLDDYLIKFYKYCFEIPSKNMLKETLNFKI